MNAGGYGQTDEITELFLKQCSLKDYPAKSIIIREGEASTDLFYIISGSVSVSISSINGKEIVLAYLNEKDYFGEICLFDTQHKYSALVRSKTKCRVAKISYDRLRSLHTLFPKLLLNIAAQLAFRLRRTSLKVSDLAFTDVQGRIARTLLDLCKEPDAQNYLDGIKIKITRKELGRIAGCSREMVGRVLKNFEESHLIQTSGKSIMVFNQPSDETSLTNI